ncbi:helix-turn-helix domain-containing protein [Chitinimonas sp.]|uniref:helix-turn-helix domain-containing protein n=1 Tax=Chitinimonas sp. TaxID=1934313 RepID=UPI0035B0FBC5
MTQDDIHLQTESLAAPTQPQGAGAILAAHRQQAGLSIDDVATKLKLAKRQVEALEADNFGQLPGNTFVRGFVRNYARLLEIDSQPLLNYLALHLPAEAPQAALPRLQDEAMPMLRPGGSGNRPLMMLGLLALLGLILLIGGAAWFLENARREPQLTVNSLAADHQVAAPATPALTIAPVAVPPPAAAAEPAAAAHTGTSPLPNQPAPAVDGATPAAANTAQPVPASSAPVPASVPAAIAAPSSAPAPTPASTPVEPKDAVHGQAGDIRLQTRDNSWVQITDAAGKVLIKENVKSGETRNLNGKPPFQVRIGNARHTDLFYKGQQTDLAPYLKGDVATLELK